MDIKIRGKVVEVPISEIVPYKNNPRLNDRAVPAVMESIKQFGFNVPIILDGDKTVVTGHTRLKAAEELGFETVPCMIVDDLTDEQVRAFRLADNKTAELASWDFEKLYGEMESLKITAPELDMADFGFNEIQFEQKKTEKEKAPEGMIICPRCGHVQGED